MIHSGPLKTRTLLLFALATAAGAQQFGTQTMMEANRQTRLTARANHGSSDRPGWWRRHLGDTALHAAATSLDAASSWGRPELHPLLRSADGRFGARGVGVKLAVFGAVEGAKWMLLRRGERGRWVRSLSLGPAVAFGGVAARNWRTR